MSDLMRMNLANKNEKGRNRSNARRDYTNKPPLCKADRIAVINRMQNGMTAQEAADDIGVSIQSIRRTRLGDEEFNKRLLQVEYVAVMENVIKSAEGYDWWEEVYVPQLDRLGDHIYNPDGTPAMKLAKKTKRHVKACPEILKIWLDEQGFDKDEVNAYMEDPEKLREDFLQRLKLAG